MFGGERQIEHTNSTETSEIRVAVLDLSQKALASYFGQLSLIKDIQPLNEHGLPGISHESRAINLGTRQNLSLPPMKVLGRLTHPDKHYDAYAVATSKPIKFRDFVLKRYELDNVEALVNDALENPGKHTIDEVDAQLLHSAFQIPDVRKAMN